MSKQFPKWSQEPPAGKQVRVSEQPESSNTQSPAWQFHKRDKDHATWGWDKLSDADFRALLHDVLCNFESMTWAEILKAAGGRNHGNNHHLIPVEKCCKEAQQRLVDLHLDDLDDIFSLRLDGKTRLFGIRDGRVLRFIWHDPDHSVYPLVR